ncbi:SMC family ATPase [Streptomyces longwoodensis]|uniref:SMC family ATPase n=1 Tax=Streptomyces longwoodensis TaxID=68231 RepID=UPI002DD8EF77|nr:SMC family ATPase [Streptomyces longwoodensis]WRY87282.1 SMC family ATPase [Streptomyces longwoodensis]
MRLHRLDLTAFGPFGAAQSVDFDELSAAGLFLLHGPTGAGKTSVLDAVCYALYGSVPGARQSGQGLALRSDHAAPGTRTEVTLDLTVAGRRLEITRQPPWERPKKRGTGTTLDKAQTWLREYDPVAGAWKDLSRSHQEVGEEVTQLLGMSREQFCQVVLLPQGDFARFLRADAEARGRLLGRLFDTQRFAEVEKRLAERRRTTEARVREGDADLLADAHRMQQAAGHAMELPDLAPGEPGLAEAVLTAAAIARSTAREQLTVAHCGRLAAESAQAAAERELAEARELARLQRRFDEARERAARLQDRADAHEEAQERMRRARKAEAVAPALELREAAEAEHRRAARAEAHARARLPERFTDAGAAGLAAAARRAAEERRARERVLEAKEHWLRVRERRLNGIAAELAARLQDGEPCAVCGATEHPAPARKDAGHVDREAEERALAAHQEAEAAHDEAEQRLSTVQRALAAAEAEAGDEPTDRLASAVEELEARHALARDAAADLHAASEELRRAEQERERRTALRQEAAVRSASRGSRREALDEERTALESELVQARGDADSVAARAAQLERRAARLTEAAEAARAAEEAAERLKAADGRLDEAAFRAGFDTPQAAADALLDDTAHRELQRRLDARQAEEAAVRAVLAEADTSAAARRPPADLAAAEDAARAAAERLRRAASAQDAAARRCAELDRLSARAAAGVRRLAPLREEYDRVARLAGLTAGTSADNERKMRLESYVLAARLEQVAAAATARLHRMSAGRYTLVHSDDRTGRGRSGLGLHVVDAWTGRERDTATLSGGETFFVSLALALGLADVVTDEAGGVRLDTLFIDEGFGSLDDQTLDDVLDVLDALRERDRSVGIVSHVADLRRRVHAQLEVVKGRSGSVLRLRGH